MLNVWRETLTLMRSHLVEKLGIEMFPCADPNRLRDFMQDFSAPCVHVTNS